MPPRDAVLDTVDAYFKYCHMQPLWLFDADDLSAIEDCRDEVVFSLLALSVCHSKHIFFQGRSKQLSRQYAQLAREHIMLRIAQGKVTLATVQSLCMLALANFHANNVHLAALHLNIAVTFSKCVGLDVEFTSSELSPAAEARRRLFWSLHLLERMYGQSVSELTILQDIENPQYVLLQPELRKRSNVLPPRMPQETVRGEEPERTGIWAYMVQLGTLWRQVRTYVMQCAHTNSEPPWSVESGYAVICAHLMDIETKIPTYHRWDSARFRDRNNEELQNRGYWSPWLYLQFTYHAIHSILNHPFLYSARPQQSAQLAVPNTFWKTSSELAFIHATWVVRLIDMVREKGYRISDPFIGQCTAVAATIHIYFCRAADRQIREAAQAKLETCTLFLGELAELWPSCRLLHDTLRALIHSAFTSGYSNQQPEPSRRTVSINTRLMWKILQYNFEGRDLGTSNHGLFHESFCRDDEDSATDHEDHTVEMHISHNPPTTEVDLSNGQALPPYSDHHSTGPNTQQTAQQHDRQLINEDLHSVSNANANADSRTPLTMMYAPFFKAPTAPWAMPSNAPVIDMTYDPFYQFQDLGSPADGAWEVGNL
ncbi:hypothetical protein CLCR_04690 [Cladophialophora carrionii]|uniref:Xylanolytic transcriptional activator regulatory domain-containing protein n=1 Tax=Cladophialophora carrionii TaxID=86049 RepID=A0A1C1CKR6_9EURO|nr:hypothetical protein CLCR_04690 [Cladophialophora carrionii]